MPQPWDEFFYDPSQKPLGPVKVVLTLLWIVVTLAGSALLICLMRGH